MSELTQSRLKEVLHYDPTTGIFTRVVTASNNKAKAGDVAGSPDGAGYLRITIDGCRYRAHRLAWLYMTGAWPAVLVDHRDTDVSNNEWGNLREATKSQNGANSIGRSHNTSGFKGVVWCGQTKMWRARIRVMGKGIHLGRFKSRKKAQSAYNAAAAEHFGQFARAA